MPLLHFGRWLDPGLSGAADVERWAGVPYLGTVPHIPAVLAKAEVSPSALLVLSPASPFARAIRNLRSAILGPPSGPGARVVALASALPNDGKTTCSLSLARQTALEGFRTVLIDCDIRRASLTPEFPPTPEMGLLDVLDGRCSVEDALLTDGLSQLRFLPVSHPKVDVESAVARDVFATNEMRAVVERLRQDFDYVFMDTPPVLAVVDARTLLPLADTVLFLSRWGRTPRHAVGLALRLVREVEADLAGLALTRGPQRHVQSEHPGRGGTASYTTAWVKRTLGRLDDEYGGTPARRLALASLPALALAALALAVS